VAALTTACHAGTPVRFEVSLNFDDVCAILNYAFDKTVRLHFAKGDASRDWSTIIRAPLESSETFIGRPLKHAMCQFGPGAKNLDTKVRHFGRKECKDGVLSDVHRQRVRAVARRTLRYRVSIESGLFSIGTVHWRPLHYRRHFCLCCRLSHVTGKREDRERCNGSQSQMTRHGTLDATDAASLQKRVEGHHDYPCGLLTFK
jgi:hypothetical protein